MLNHDKYFNEYKLLLQYELNNRMKFLGFDKFQGNEGRLVKDGGIPDTSTGKSLSSKAVKGFVAKLTDYIFLHQEVLGDDGEIKSLAVKRTSPITKHGIDEKIDPVMLARIVLSCLLYEVSRPEGRKRTTVGVVFDIGWEVDHAVKQINLDLHHAKEVKKVKDMLRRQGRIGDKAEIREKMEELACALDVPGLGLDNHTQGVVGQILLEILLESEVEWEENPGLVFSDLFHYYNKRDPGTKHVQKFIETTDLGIEWIAATEQFLSEQTVSFLPMVLPPKAWTSPVDGGYYDPAINTKYHIIKSRPKSYSKKMFEKSPEGFHALMDAINTLQNVPFSVSKYVHSAVKWAHESQICLEGNGMPTYRSGWVETIGEELAAEYFTLKRLLTQNEDGTLDEPSKKLRWEFLLKIIKGSEDMDESDIRKEWSRLREAALLHSRGERSKKLLIENTINDSSLFFGEDIFFVYNADYRGRIYPLASQFSPQGSDVSKGLLNYANPVWVSTQGAVDQIAYVIANNFGEDKCSIEDRIQWTKDHTFEILECARDFKATDFWMKADKPFMFLNSCLEWAKYWDEMVVKGQDGFESTLPIAFDGSCNGIQHFSAMFLDPVGAQAVNLTDGDVPSDVYQQVADKAKDLCTTGNSKDDKDITSLCAEGIDLFGRKTAKRSVMTLPYGVSRGSSNKYVYEIVDSKLKDTEVPAGRRKKIRSKIAARIWEGIFGVVDKPVVAKDYLQSVAKELAEQQKGIEWKTPTGFIVSQRMTRPEVNMVALNTTIFGLQYRRKYPRYTRIVDGGEQANSVAPNYVHSFDSAHLQMTVNASAKEGIENFLVVHDSFATDANNAARFNEIIREQFVEIYRNNDWLNKFHDDCTEQLGTSLETGRMSQGTFDMNEVLKSKFFFS